MWNSISFILISLLGFVNFTLNLKTYESNIFGLYLLLSAYWSIGASIDFGFGVSSIKNIAEALKISDYNKINKIINTFLFTYLIVGTIICSVIIGLFYAYDSVENASFGIYNIDILLLFFGLGFLCRYLAGFLITVYEGLSEFVLVSKINLSLTVFNTILTLIIYFQKLSLYYLVGSQFVYALFLFLVLLFRLRYIDKLSILKPQLFDFSLIRKDGFYNLNIQLSFILTSFIDPFSKTILGYFLGLQYVTFFESAKKIINLSNGLIYSATKGMLNKISESNAAGQLKEFMNDKLSVFLNLTLDYSLLVYGVLNPAICLFILLWFKSYESMMIFLIFLLPYTLINSGGPLYSILIIEGKGGKMVILQLINLLLVTGFLYLSLSISQSYLGLLGFFIATLINSMLMIYFLRRYLGLDFHRFFANVKLRDLAIINVVLIIQIIVFSLFKDLTYYFMFILSIVYPLLFRKQLHFLGGLVLRNIRRFLKRKEYSNG